MRKTKRTLLFTIIFALILIVGVMSVYASDINVTTTPTNPNQAELYQLRSFAQQSDNLDRLGWNLNDPSTWSGILWTDGETNHIQSIDISYNFLLGFLDLSGFAALEYLDIAGNFIHELDLSGCYALIYLNCFNNSLQSLTVPRAEIVTVSSNRLTSLDVSGAANLRELYAGQNLLTELDLSNNTALTNLNIGDNNLLILDLAANTALRFLRATTIFYTFKRVRRYGCKSTLLESSTPVRFWCMSDRK